MKCHMHDNSYTHYDKLDYPSIAQINKVAKDKNIYIIFAVSDEQGPLYKQLAKRIQGANAAQMSANSSGIVNIIYDEYKEISSVLRIRQEPLKIDGLQITFTYKCDNQTRQSSNGTAECPIKPNEKKM